MKLNVFETKGESVLAFADYLETLEQDPKTKADHLQILKKAGTNLLKSGFTFHAKDRGQYGMNHTLEDKVFRFDLPYNAKSLDDAIRDENIGVWDATDNNVGSFYRTSWQNLQYLEMKKLRDMHVEHIRLQMAVKDEFEQ